MIWAFVIVVAIVVGCFAFEGTWDRRLFTEGCRNLSASEAKAWLREHPETALEIENKVREHFGVKPRGLKLIEGGKGAAAA